LSGKSRKVDLRQFFVAKVPAILILLFDIDLLNSFLADS